jgi:hypothetical protein
MDDAGLESAMRLGARDPRSERHPDDLGRFGLGLKTAGFSLGRRLTVASKPAGGSISCLRWDLDLIQPAGSSGWDLFEGPDPGSVQLISPLESMPHGTIVLVEILDRVVSETFASSDMIALTDEVEAHLAMVFHRMLSSTASGFRLRLNDRTVKGWDPFLLGHPGKAIESLEYRVFDPSYIRVQLHVLPHRDMLSPDEYARAGGPGGWIQHEGFYVYRNKRLLLAGGWLGMGEGGRSWTRDEPHRLARVRLDIINSDDAEWKIDVRKSTASVPIRLRPQLLRLGKEVRAVARRAFAGRGRSPIASQQAEKRLPDPWSAVRSPLGTSYKIERTHDLIASVLDRAGSLKADLTAVFRLLEETLPVQRIWIDTAEEKETPRTGFSGATDNEILATLQPLYQALVTYSRLSPDDARERLLRTPPFTAYGHLIGALGSDGTL